MKSFCIVVLMVAVAGMAARAESGTNAAPQPRKTDIYSDSAVFDGSRHTVTYSGNVRVSDPDMKLTCAQLVADLPESGGRPTRIVAETNVVIDSTDSKGQTTHVTGDKAVYVYNVQTGMTNETVTLTGNPQPQVENAQGTMVADVIVWDRASNSYRFSGNYHLVSGQNFGVPADTNAPTATTNNPAMPKTDFPPGTIQDIDRMNVPTRGDGGGF
jgi:lipopolysaccharide export system protein LptA